MELTAAWEFSGAWSFEPDDRERHEGGAAAQRGAAPSRGIAVWRVEHGAGRGGDFAVAVLGGPPGAARPWLTGRGGGGEEPFVLEFRLCCGQTHSESAAVSRLRWRPPPCRLGTSWYERDAASSGIDVAHRDAQRHGLCQKGKKKHDGLIHGSGQRSGKDVVSGTGCHRHRLGGGGARRLGARIGRHPMTAFPREEPRDVAFGGRITERCPRSTRHPSQRGARQAEACRTP